MRQWRKWDNFYVGVGMGECEFKYIFEGWGWVGIFFGGWQWA